MNTTKPTTLASSLRPPCFYQVDAEAPSAPGSFARITFHRELAIAPPIRPAPVNPTLALMRGDSVGIPKAHDAGAAYVRAFVEEMKASGFVAKALAASGQADAAVAPASP
jgi:hypothetical protein